MRGECVCVCVRVPVQKHCVKHGYLFVEHQEVPRHAFVDVELSGPVLVGLPGLTMRGVRFRLCRADANALEGGAQNAPGDGSSPSTESGARGAAWEGGAEQLQAAGWTRFHSGTSAARSLTSDQDREAHGRVPID